MKKIHKPIDGFPSFYKPYLDLVPNDGDLLQHLQDIIHETEKLVSTLSEGQLNYRYNEGKWNIKEIIHHIADCERVIIYRAMRIGRGDQTDLPGFDESLLVLNAHAGSREITDIVNELSALRNPASPLLKHSMKYL